jgi:hypothetical protein
MLRSSLAFASAVRIARSLPPSASKYDAEIVREQFIVPMLFYRAQFHASRVSCAEFWKRRTRHAEIRCLQVAWHSMQDNVGQRAPVHLWL